MLRKTANVKANAQMATIYFLRYKPTPMGKKIIVWLLSFADAFNKSSGVSTDLIFSRSFPTVVASSKTSARNLQLLWSMSASRPSTRLIFQKLSVFKCHLIAAVSGKIFYTFKERG